jgi:hypothetical protein
MKKKELVTVIEPDGYTIGFMRRGDEFLNLTDGMTEIPLTLCTAYVEGCTKDALKELNGGFIPDEDFLDEWAKNNNITLKKQ